MSSPGIVLAFNPPQHAHLIPYIAAIHASCITHDRTMATFLPPLSHEKLLAWWKERIAEINDGSRLMYFLVSDLADDARPKGPEVMGVVMLAFPFSETAQFRATVEMLLIHKNFRGRGAARTLMGVLEAGAAQRGRTTLVRCRKPQPGTPHTSVTDCSNSGLRRRRVVPQKSCIGSSTTCSWAASPGLD